MNASLRRVVMLSTAASAAAALTALSSSSAVTAATVSGEMPSKASVVRSGDAKFINFEPAGLAAFGLPQGGGSVGTVCPGDGADTCYNGAGEPAVRADSGGNFYASSENGLGAGTEAWRSLDGGKHYITLPSPNAGSTSNNTGFAPGGGDTDLAVGDQQNGAGFYPLYVASLNLADIDVSASQDGGNSFSLQPLASRVPVDDREWIAADDSHQGPDNKPVDGGDKVCISYHDAIQNISVDCDYAGGTLFLQHGSAIDADHAPYLVANNAIGNLAIAGNLAPAGQTSGDHNIYQIFTGPKDIAGTTACGGFTCYNAVYMGVSTDGGLTFVDHLVHLNPDINVSYGHQFANVSVDTAGNVYAVYNDNHNLYYSFSKTQGTSWRGPFRVNRGKAKTAIMPWSVAGSDGKLDVVFYGSTHAPDAGETPDTYPDTAPWHVYFAQNLAATTPRSGFTQVEASPINHYGAVCEGGVGCTGNRDLYDDFGVAASPTTGLASILYDDDQYRDGDTRNPNPPGCTAATTNSGSCVHTAIATQVAGSGIF